MFPHSDVNPDTIRFKSKARERQRQENIKRRAEEALKMDKEKNELDAKRRKKNEAWCVAIAKYLACCRNTCPSWTPGAKYPNALSATSVAQVETKDCQGQKVEARSRQGEARARENRRRH